MIAKEGENIVCRVRGITLNYHASQLVKFDVFRDMILEQRELVGNMHMERKIKRKRKGVATVAIVTETENKDVEFHFPKGGESMTIRPFFSGINRCGPGEWTMS